MIYNDKLKEIREERNIHQIDLAKILNIKIQTFSMYETGYTIIPIKHLITLCDYFDISIDYVFNFTDEINYKNFRKKIEKDLAGERLKEFRKENKLTQKKLADILNTEKSVISKYERGINIIATPFLYQICKKYNISADYLLGKIDSPKYIKTSK